MQQPRPPIVIGGGGERLTLQVVAKYADMWNIIPASVAEFARKSAILDAHCVEVGRDPQTIERSVQVVADLAQPEEVQQSLRGYINAGATHLILELQPPLTSRMVNRVADTLIPDW